MRLLHIRLIPWLIGIGLGVGQWLYRRSGLRWYIKRRVVLRRLNGIYGIGIDRIDRNRGHGTKGGFAPEVFCTHQTRS